MLQIFYYQHAIDNNVSYIFVIYKVNKHTITEYLAEMKYLSYCLMYINHSAINTEHEVAFKHFVYMSA